MGCFGDMEPTKTVDSNSTTAPPAWVQAAGQQNYNDARSVLDRGYVPYTAPRVADLSNSERMASDIIGGAASTGNPWTGTAANAFTNYGSAPGFNYDFSSIMDPNGPLGSVQGYMNPYLDAVLAPALRQLGISGAQQRQGINANATQAGAYGDARHGVVESEQRKNQAQTETDVVGRAFSDAFGSAMQNRQQDASRYFQTQQAQEGADKSALERARTSGIDLTNLDKYEVARKLGLASALGTAGANERSVEQAKLDATYAEEMRKQGFTQNQIAFLTSILKGTPTAITKNGTETTSQPDNSGWNAVGTAASMAASLFL